MADQVENPIGAMLIAGASKGIGAAMAAHYDGRVGDLVTTSRTKAAHGRWLPCDISRVDHIRRLAGAFGDGPLDALLVLGGTWEDGAFTDAYSFDRSSLEETERVIAVNLVGPIQLVQAFLPNLRRSANPRVVLMGALMGLDKGATPEVANTASKHGLGGAAHALTLALRSDRIGVTVINPGNLATDEVIDDIAAGRFGDQVPIPLDDLAATIDYALSLSPASTVHDISLGQREPGA